MKWNRNYYLFILTYKQANAYFQLLSRILIIFYRTNKQTNIGKYQKLSAIVFITMRTETETETTIT